MTDDIERHTVDIRPFMLVAKIADHMAQQSHTPIRIASLASDRFSYAAGRSARLDDVALLANPYLRTTWDWQSWRSGWTAEDVLIRHELHQVNTAIRDCYTYGH